MPKRYSIAEARKNLPSLVTEAESGYVVELTRRGDRVAVLLSIHEYQRMKGKRAAFKEAYTDFLSRFDLDEYGVDQEFAGGLRDKSIGRDIDL